MFCPNCATPYESGTPFCGNCGTALSANPNAASQSTVPNEQIEKVKSFLKNNLWNITKTIFGEPIKGTQNVFSEAGSESYFYSIILYATTACIYVLLPYIVVGDSRSYIGFSNFLKIGIAVFIMLFMISVLTFAIKSVSAKADFKKELLTGALCGIPMMVLIILLSIITLFSSSSSMWNIMQNPQAALNSGIVIFIVIIYILLMLINIIQQSLKSSGSSDAVAWYFSPAVVTLAFYLGGKISYQLLIH